MKDTEVRIGNYVTYLRRDEPIQITGKDLHDSIEGRPFNPIPLTEEWLTKFGFKHTEESSWATGEEVKYKVFRKGDLAYNSIQNAWWMRGRMSNDYKYVHQLQNLIFALTGEEVSLI